MKNKASSTQLKARIEKQLIKRVNKESQLKDVLTYVIGAGGKRFRALLVYNTADLFGQKIANADSAAVAIEFIHIYSLIHDDLPAMDDDDMRHGVASCHRQFGEAKAILTGDLLQGLAFETIASDKKLTDKQKTAMITVLSKQAQRMVDGQTLDLAITNHKADLTTLNQVHQLKTGALLSAAIELGALTEPAITKAQLKKLRQLAAYIGLAYQIQDDVLEVTSDEKKLGKSTTSDSDNNKTTYVDLMSVELAIKKYQILYVKAQQILTAMQSGDSQLKNLITRMQTRVN